MLVFNFGPFLEGGFPVIEDVAYNVQYHNYGMAVSQQLCSKNSFGQIIVSFNPNFSSFAFIEVPDIVYFISKNVGKFSNNGINSILPLQWYLSHCTSAAWGI